MDANQWLHNGNLIFHSVVNECTGEILNKNRYAVANGLRFELVRSTVADKVHNFCKGSLAKFYNNGLHNGFDYDFNQFADTLKTLQSQYAINADNAILQGFEFGVNINCLIPIKTLLQCIKAYKGNSFAMLKVDGVQVGYQLPMQRYTLKIYDKGLQVNKKDSNLLRIEISVNKMIYVNALNIVTLNDLHNVDVWHELGKILLQFWNDTIFIPKKVAYKAMPNQQQKKFLRYMDANYWHDLTKMQRYRSQRHLNQLLNNYNTDTTKQDIMDLISKKLNKLTPQKCYQLTNFFKQKQLPISTPEMLPFNRLDKGLNSNQNNKLLSIDLEGKIKRQKRQSSTLKINSLCKCCRQSLKHKKTGAKYCSAKCKSKALSKLRKEKRANTKAKELKTLKRLISIAPKQTFWLMITYTDKAKETFADYLHQSEIYAPPNWIREIKRVDVKAKTANTTLTSYRAKRLIKIICQLNEGKKHKLK